MIRGYHAHVYFDAQSRATAVHLRDAVDRRFRLSLGRLHDQPVGPHTQGMYQIAFAVDQLSELVPWLMLNRQGLNILVHPCTGDDMADHTAHAMWLGQSLPLNLEVLR